MVPEACHPRPCLGFVSGSSSGSGIGLKLPQRCDRGGVAGPSQPRVPGPRALQHKHSHGFWEINLGRRQAGAVCSCAFCNKGRVTSPSQVEVERGKDGAGMGKKDTMEGKASATCSVSHQELSPLAIWLQGLPAGEKEVSAYVIRVEKQWKACKMCCD